MKCPKFVAKIEDFEEAYRDTLTKKTQCGAEFWTFRQASYVFPRILRLDWRLVLKLREAETVYWGRGGKGQIEQTFRKQRNVTPFLMQLIFWCFWTEQVSVGVHRKTAPTFVEAVCVF